jgi:hypothetical protein
VRAFPLTGRALLAACRSRPAPSAQTSSVTFESARCSPALVTARCHRQNTDDAPIFNVGAGGLFARGLRAGGRSLWHCRRAQRRVNQL